MSSEVAPNPSSSIFNQSYFSTTDTTGLDTTFLALNYLAYPVSQTATETIDSLAITQNNIKINDMTLGSGANALNNNTACGVDCLANATGAGNANTAFGYHAGDSITTGDSNTAFGSLALQASTTAVYATAVGYDALGDRTSGTTNDALGSEALAKTTTGDDNVGIGYRAGYTNTTGSSNTFIGYQADATGTNYSYSTVIGAGAEATGNNQIVLGTSADELLYYSPITPTYTTPSFDSGVIGEVINNNNSGGATTITGSTTFIVSITLTAGTWYIIGGVQISASSTTLNAQISLDVGAGATYFPSSLGFAGGGYNSIRYITGSGSQLAFMQVSTHYHTSSSVSFRLGGVSNTGNFTVPAGEGYIRAIRIA